MITEGGGKAEVTIQALATVQLELESRPESVTLVRSMLAGLGEYLEFDPELMDDLKTAISEACNNVVLHAYRGETGPLRVSMNVTEDDFQVSVRDEGIGIQRISPAVNRMGVGLAVISALARRAEFLSEPERGTEVKMSFGSDGVGAYAELAARGGVVTVKRPAEVGGEVVVTLGPSDLLLEVMGRLVRTVAAGAHFSVDRFPSLHRLTGAISARAVEMDRGGEVSFSISGHSKHLELKVGPLPGGSTANLFDGPPPPGLDGLIQRLESVSVPDGELLEVVVVDPRR
ncbi:MAG TPA: ATP-binding protein [Solirubrobacteraceae bacterium]|nr:ATP-binding protein [Solirubrobacteraceae bacterium]